MTPRPGTLCFARSLATVWSGDLSRYVGTVHAGDCCLVVSCTGSPFVDIVVSNGVMGRLHTLDLDAVTAGTP